MASSCCTWPAGANFGHPGIPPHTSESYSNSRKEAVMTRVPHVVSSSVRRYTGIFTVAVVSAACNVAQAELLPLEEDVTDVESPAGPGSSGQYLQTGDGGVVYLSWMEPMDESVMASASSRRGAFRMRFAERVNGVWSEPRTIAQDDQFGVNWASFPSFIRLPNGSLATHYSGRAPDGTRRGGVSLSHDGGTTWSLPAGGGGGFLRLFPWESDKVGGIWLHR